MFEGKITAKVNRYGQETTQHVRRLTLDDINVVQNSRVNGNAVKETASEDRPTTVRILTVHPNCFK